MMPALDATLGGAILEADWQPSVGEEDMYFLVTRGKHHFVHARVVAVGPRGYRIAFVDPSLNFLEEWELAVLCNSIS